MWVLAQQPLGPWPRLVMTILSATGFCHDLRSKHQTEGQAPSMWPQGGCQTPQAVCGLLRGAPQHPAYLLWASHTDSPTQHHSTQRDAFRSRREQLPGCSLSTRWQTPRSPCAAPRRSWRPRFPAVSWARLSSLGCCLGVLHIVQSCYHKHIHIEHLQKTVGHIKVSINHWNHIMYATLKAFSNQ